MLYKFNFIHLFVENSVNHYMGDGDEMKCDPEEEYSDRENKILASLDKNYIFREENIESEISRLPDSVKVPDLGIQSYLDYDFFVSKGEHTCSEEETKEWMKDGSFIKVIKYGRILIPDPNYHPERWCTTQELIKCYYKEVIKYGINEIEENKLNSIIGFMRNYELTSKEKVRAIYCFDNPFK